MGKTLARDTDMNPHKPISVCFFGFSESEEGGRAWMVRTGLAENGVIIKPCRTDVRGFFPKYLDLYKKWKEIIGDVDAIYVIFMGYYLMPLAWYLARQRGIPVILDTLVSQYDTEVNDRKRLSRYNPRAWFLWIVDRFSCFIADAIVVDTLAHQKYFAEEFHINIKKIIVVSVGCRSDIFVPLKHENKVDDEFVLEFHGSFIPLQGLEYVMEAAKILQNRRERIRFEIIGDGQTYPTIKNIAQKLNLINVEFLSKIPISELPMRIARADACLGIFGTTEKALRVIPHKVYECLSCGKPVITERSPASLKMLNDRKDVLLVEPGNGADLAEKILELKNDGVLRKRLGEQARNVSVGTFSTRVIVKNLVDWIESHT